MAHIGRSQLCSPLTWQWVALFRLEIRRKAGLTHTGGRHDGLHAATLEDGLGFRNQHLSGVIAHNRTIGGSIRARNALALD